MVGKPAGLNTLPPVTNPQMVIEPKREKKKKKK